MNLFQVGKDENAGIIQKELSELDINFHFLEDELDQHF